MPDWEKFQLAVTAPVPMLRDAVEPLADRCNTVLAVPPAGVPAGAGAGRAGGGSGKPKARQEKREMAQPREGSRWQQ